MSVPAAIRRFGEYLYGRSATYSPRIDKYNRLPLLEAFRREYAGVPAFRTREALWTNLAREADGVIDYLEFGVHEGHSILYWASLNTDERSRFFGFDSFRGLPEAWNDAYPKGHFDTRGIWPETSDPRVAFVPGLFQESLPGFLKTYGRRGRLVVHFDCDLYSSALFCLTQIDGFVRPGDIFIFDEFGDVLHEHRAFCDYVSAYRRSFRAICAHDDFFTTAVQIV